MLNGFLKYFFYILQHWVLNIRKESIALAHLSKNFNFSCIWQVLAGVWILNRDANLQDPLYLKRQAESSFNLNALGLLLLSCGTLEVLNNLHAQCKVWWNHQVLHWLLKGFWNPTGPDRLGPACMKHFAWRSAEVQRWQRSSRFLRFLGTFFPPFFLL